jgi:hypothetical protein
MAWAFANAVEEDESHGSWNIMFDAGAFFFF